MKIKAKIKNLPTIYKGHDIIFLKGGKEHAEIVIENGEIQASYKHTLIDGDLGYVQLYLFNNEQYFILIINGKIKSCVYV